MLGKWELNKVHCEDSYKVIQELPSKSVDCIYTDIPYLYYQGSVGNSELSKRMKKKKSELQCISCGIDYEILQEFVGVMKKINCFIWCSKLQILEIMKFFIEKQKCLFELLCWCKTNPSPTTNNSWLPNIEYCLYFRENGIKLNNGYQIKSKYYESGLNIEDKKKYKHPTIKPMPLVRQHLLHATQPNDIIFDPFAGSGTTGVACQDIGRQFIGFEIEQKWVKVANDRLQKVDSNGQIGLFAL